MKPTIWAILVSVGLTGLLVLFSVVIIPTIFSDQIEERNLAYEERKAWLDELDKISKESTDCTELKTTMLELIEQGANAETWDKYRDDKILKMAKDRHEVLCE